MALATKPSWAEPIASRHHPVGASTGYTGDLRGDWTAQIAMALEVSPFAVELSALSEPELPSLGEFPLTVADEGLFRPILERCLDVPWIFEAPPRGLV